MRNLLRIFAIIYIILFIQSISSASDSKALFEQGMEAFRSGNYGSSELLFRKIIDYNDDHLDRQCEALRGKRQYPQLTDKCTVDQLKTHEG